MCFAEDVDGRLRSDSAWKSILARPSSPNRYVVCMKPPSLSCCFGRRSGMSGNRDETMLNVRKMRTVGKDVRQMLIERSVTSMIFGGS